EMIWPLVCRCRGSGSRKNPRWLFTVIYHHCVHVPIGGSMPSEELRTATPAAPNLILLPSVSSPGASGVQMHEPIVLGLRLPGRPVLAAHRAGYGQMFFLARDRAEPPGTTAISDWSRLAEVLLRSQAASLVIAPATILSETNWLKRLPAARLEPAA